MPDEPHQDQPSPCLPARPGKNRKRGHFELPVLTWRCSSSHAPSHPQDLPGDQATAPWRPVGTLARGLGAAGAPQGSPPPASRELWPLLAPPPSQKHAPPFLVRVRLTPRLLAPAPHSVVPIPHRSQVRALGHWRAVGACSSFTAARCSNPTAQARHGPCRVAPRPASLAVVAASSYFSGHVAVTWQSPGSHLAVTPPSRRSQLAVVATSSYFYGRAST
ncbi:hypothetical protein ES708_18378 [subsurface metagenome]